VGGTEVSMRIETKIFGEIEISEGLLPQARANPNIEILTDLYDLPFDGQGNLF